MYRLLIGLFCLFAGFAHAQTVPFFEQTYGTEAPDFTRSAVLHNNSIYTAGFFNTPNGGSTDISVYRITTSGVVFDTIVFARPQYDDNAQHIIAINNNRLAICGDLANAGGNLSGFILLMDTAGNMIDSAHSSLFAANLTFKKMALLADGNIAVVGFATGTANSNDFLIEIYSPSLTRLYRSIEGSPSNDYLQTVVALPDSGYVVAGDQLNSGQYDMFIARYDKTHNPLWQHVHGDTLQNGCQDMILTSDNHLAICGETEIAPSSPFNFFIEKVDLNGNMIWNSTFGGAQANAAFAIVETTDGFMGAGYSNSFGPGPISVAVFRTDTAGNMLWAHQYGSTGIDIGYSIFQGFGGYYIAGNSDVNGNNQCYLLHVDEGGWATTEEYISNGDTRLFPNPTSGTFVLTGIAPGSSFEVYDISGKIIESGVANETTISFNTDGELANGIYAIRVISNGKTFTHKLIISR
jgi:hypothetical protein